MRLINLSTYELEEHDDYALPKYAILSHRWEKQEVLYADWKGVNHWRQADPDSRPKGWQKLLSFCDVARDQHESHYGWADTVCIDKSSSSELTQAINSMYRYYQESTICIVYLADVFGNLSPFSEPGGNPSVSKVCESQWFTRGWTLQELIAPPVLVFHTCAWRELGTLRDSIEMMEAIKELTNIPTSVLCGNCKPDEFPLAKRMSWATGRTTTRPEDRAYSLLGLFDVNLPLLYGEGNRAFLRLQEEIVRRSTDHTIFAWHARSDASAEVSQSLFAPSPDEFFRVAKLDIMECYRDLEGWVESFEVTNHGLEISLPLIRCQSSPDGVYHAVLNCCIRGSHGPITLNIQTGGKMFGRRNQRSNFRPLLQPLSLSSDELGECTAIHDGRLAWIFEEELITAQKSQVTILRRPDRHFLLHESSRDALLGTLATMMVSRRAMLGVEPHTELARQDRIPREAWFGESSIWVTRVARRAGVSFRMADGRSFGLILYSTATTDLSIGVAVAKMSDDEERTLQSALASSRVYASRKQVGAGCSIAFALNAMKRSLIIKLEVVLGMESEFFVLTAALAVPGATEANRLGLHMGRDSPAISTMRDDEDFKLLDYEETQVDSTTGGLLFTEDLFRPLVRDCDGMPPHNHVPIKAQAGRTLIEKIAHSVYRVS
ncbi:hypothetical protein LTR97_010750 [Elasticomyces elasticus]|uniref:Heterokaryon incompatibility domain-containing protein n=1 Tax=Elasticomyces elasticus TaxID=574655 RepID=A0AAN7W2Z5_9PEZI|nr:hypothetical protein LTR97_010750 [Elasticomyces elasticus]